MAIPASGYASYTPTALPSTEMTDWTGVGIITGEQTDFWAEAENVDPRRARYANNSGPTELPGAPIYYDYAGEVFVFAYKITMPTSSGPTIRVYPPRSANDLYAASDTFGSDNAFDSVWEAFLPLTENPEDSAPQFQDLTANGNHGTANGTILNSQKNTGGPINISLNLNNEQYIEIANTHGLTNQFSWAAWFLDTSSIAFPNPFPRLIYFDAQNFVEAKTFTLYEFGDSRSSNVATAWSSSTYIGASINSSGGGVEYADTTATAFTAGTPALSGDTIQFPQNSTVGLAGTPIAMIQLHNDVRDGDWHAYNQAMMADVAAYMGTLTWNAASSSGPEISGVSPDPIEAEGTATITVDAYDTVSGVTYNGVALASVAEATSTTITATAPKGGQAFGSSNNIVVTDANGSSAGFAVEFAAPNGYLSVTMTADYANLPTTSMFYGLSGLSGVVTGDQVAYETTAEDLVFDGEMVLDEGVSLSAGTYDFDYYILDASDGYSAGTTGNIEFTVADTTPDQFTFTDVTNVALSTQQTSNTIIVSGLGVGVSADVTVTGGTYSINGGTYTSDAGTAENDDEISVRHTSSSSSETAVNTVLTIGGVSDTFTSTTEANQSLVINDQTFYVLNGATAGQAAVSPTATDAENDELTWSITAGNTNTDWQINSSTGQISNLNTLDSGTTASYSLTVQVTDGVTAADTATITINVIAASTNVVSINRRRGRRF